VSTTTPVTGTASVTQNASAAIAQTTSQAMGTGSSGSSGGKSTLNYDMFLKLLTAQLKNQDPMSPMDPNQFMSQLAQLSTVEQSMKTNDNLTQLLDAVKSSGMRMDMAYIGRSVEASSNALALSGGSAKTAYAVDGTAAGVRIEVQNDAGQTIYATAGAAQRGRQVFTWNGAKADGTTAPDGLYHVKISAADKDGKTLSVATVITDTVKEVRTNNGVTSLVLKGGATVADTDVLSAS
jgi:flagellar basal-body rod modification protein FlgD